MGQGPDTIAAVGQIKLVNPDATQMSEGADGLMHMNDGSTADADDTVSVTSGALEASNVNPSSELAKMISLSRQYEMQVRSIKTAEDDADSSTKLLQTS
jgi:flagellar basal-body rod protein FlgF